MSSKSFGSHNCRSGKVSCPENCGRNFDFDGTDIFQTNWINSPALKFNTVYQTDLDDGVGVKHPNNQIDTISGCANLQGFQITKLHMKKYNL